MIGEDGDGVDWPDAGRVRYEPLLETRSDAAAAGRDDGFSAFAAAHLAEGAGSFLVSDAFATYRAFRRAAQERAMPRAAFGARLSQIVRDRGGTRCGDRVADACLVLVGGVTAPAHEAIRAPSRPVPIAPNRRPPIVLGWKPRERRGRRVISIENDGSRREWRVPS